jgi:hypothetical protein
MTAALPDHDERMPLVFRKRKEYHSSAQQRSTRREVMATQPATKPAGLYSVRFDSGHSIVELEDESVRVVRLMNGPREMSAMLRHQAMTGGMLTGATVPFTYPDGKPKRSPAKPDRSLTFRPSKHLPENLSDQAFEPIAGGKETIEFEEGVS